MKTPVARFILLFAFGLSNLGMMSLLLKMPIAWVSFCFALFLLVLLFLPLPLGFAVALFHHVFFFPAPSEWRLALPLILLTMALFFLLEKEKGVRKTEIRSIVWIAFFLLLKGFFVTAYYEAGGLFFLHLLGGVSAIFFFSFSAGVWGQFIAFGLFFICSFLIGSSLQPQEAMRLLFVLVPLHLLIYISLMIRASVQNTTFYESLQAAKPLLSLFYFLGLKMLFFEFVENSAWLQISMDNLLFQLGFIAMLDFFFQKEKTPFFKMPPHAPTDKRDDIL